MPPADSQAPPRTGAVTGVLELLAFLREPDYARRRFAALGDVFETVLAGQPQVFVRGPDRVAELMGQAAALEGWWPASVSQLLGPFSLANRNGEAHLARRRAVGKLFSAQALRGYGRGIGRIADTVVEGLASAPPPVALAGWMRSFAFQVIAEEVLGLPPEGQAGLFDDFELWTRGLFSLPIAYPTSRLARAKAARRRLLHRIHGLLPSLTALADARDEAGLPLNDADLADQLLLLLFAGYETTASSLTLAVLLLLQHPATLVWLQEELDSLSWPPGDNAPDPLLPVPDPENPVPDPVAPGPDPLERLLDELETLPRLNAVIKEVLRLVPPVGGLFRRAIAPVRLGGWTIAPGRVIQVDITATQRHGDAFPDGDTFRPERHLEAPAAPSALLPFGVAPRVCLGRPLAELELRLLLSRLLRRLRFSLVSEQDLTLEVIPTPRPRSGLLVRVERR